MDMCLATRAVLESMDGRDILLRDRDSIWWPILKESEGCRWFYQRRRRRGTDSHDEGESKVMCPLTLSGGYPTSRDLYPSAIPLWTYVIFCFDRDWTRELKKEEKENKKMSDTISRSPFVGQRIKVHGHKGTIKFIGQVDGVQGLWLGIEWDDSTRGKHSGEKNGKHYFTCKYAPIVTFFFFNFM